MHGRKTVDGSIQHIFVLMLFYSGFQVHGVPNSSTNKMKAENADIFQRHRVVYSQYVTGMIVTAFVSQVMLATIILLVLVYLWKVVEFRNNVIQVD